MALTLRLPFGMPSVMIDEILRGHSRPGTGSLDWRTLARLARSRMTGASLVAEVVSGGPLAISGNSPGAELEALSVAVQLVTISVGNFCCNLSPSAARSH
jgi:hypothetical protein